MLTVTTSQTLMTWPGFASTMRPLLAIPVLLVATQGAHLAHADPVVKDAASFVVLDIVASGAFRVDVLVHFQGAGAAMVTGYVGDEAVAYEMTRVWSYERSAEVEVVAEDRAYAARLSVENASSWSTGSGGSSPQPHSVIIAAFGEVAHLEYEVKGAATWQESATGPTNWAHLSDLAPAASAEATLLSPTAGAVVGGTLDFEIEHRLIGWFGRAVDLASYSVGAILHGPGGSALCPCRHVEIPGDAPGLPGAYRLEWTGAVASYGDWPYIAWADVPR